MADESLLTLSQIIEAQINASTRLYGVVDPAGTPADVFLPMGVLGAYAGFYKIAPSVASNNLTLALQHLDGTDPSTTNPLAFKIGTGWQVVDAALSFTKNAATNWANLGSSELAAKNHDLFVYLIQETGASAGTKLGWSRIPYATTMADFSATDTNEKYIAGSYTNKNATDEVVNIGRFRAQLSATASFNWSIPSAKVIHFPIYATDWLTWTPALSAGGSMTYTSTTVDLADYMINWRNVEYEIKCHGTTGGSASNSIVATLPFAASNGSVGAAQGGHVSDSANRGSIISIGTNGLNFSRYDDANFGLGSDRYIASVGKYKIG